MRVRTLVLDPEIPDHRVWFQYLWTGFLSGGGVAAQKRQAIAGKASHAGFDERRVEAGVLRALKGVSVPSSESAPEPMEVDTRPRSLIGDSGPQTLILTQPGFDLLVEFCTQTPWSTGIMDAAEDAIDFLLSAAAGTKD